MAKLVRGVWVDGQHYGRDRQPPDEVARQITNPLAWEGGEVPFPASEDAAGESSGTVTADQAPQEPRGDETAESEQPATRSRSRRKG